MSRRTKPLSRRTKKLIEQAYERGVVAGRSTQKVHDDVELRNLKNSGGERKLVLVEKLTQTHGQISDAICHAIRCISEELRG